jgi:hypothetical protein
MLSFRRSPEVGLSGNSGDIAISPSEKDFGIPAGNFGIASDSDSDINPGELTFEEGTSRVGPILSSKSVSANKY